MTFIDFISFDDTTPLSFNSSRKSMRTIEVMVTFEMMIVYLMLCWSIWNFHNGWLQHRVPGLHHWTKKFRSISFSMKIFRGVPKEFVLLYTWTDHVVREWWGIRIGTRSFISLLSLYSSSSPFSCWVRWKLISLTRVNWSSIRFGDCVTRDRIPILLGNGQMTNVKVSMIQIL